eukprot:CAMPEP_0204899152 /NCGR_PEP_ID=MMETSP1397-20131031/1686_1 /ASSEMBLY_ACC=CAM_ASM_000891 /TAXON_ID=49980 /ORGANISM="Climacostomum Climacostomum virens, Strain Stock W-24" /LENGTH=391 /DNA_ID=CAMNT_0052067069 /DNA_START=1734 /DNA_END=2909 /DNA_ORIENTATION=+
MTKLTAFVALLALSSATLFKQVTSPMAVLTEISAQMRNGGRADEIYKQLDKLEHEIVSEQAEHDTLYASQKEQCDDEAAFRAQEVADATFAIERATNESKNCGEAQATSEQNLERNLEDQRIVKEQTEDAHKTRKENRELYEKRTQDHDDLIEAIDESLELLSQLRSESSFVQISQKATSLLIKSSRIRMTKHVAPFIAALAQLNQHSDQDAVNKVVELLNRLRDNTDASQADYDQQEADSIQRYNDLIDSLTSEKERLEREEPVIRQHIGDMKACVARQDAVYSEAYAKQSRNQDIYDSSASLCEGWINEYNTETDTRNYELSLIAELREMIYRRYGESGEGIRHSEKKQYENKTVYQNGEKYTYDETTYNESGASGAGYARDESLEKLF